MAKSATPLGVDYDGMRNSSLDLHHTGDELLRLATDGPKLGEPFTGLPAGALGLVGELARSKHNETYRDFVEDLAAGAKSAKGMGRIVKVNRDGYATAEGAAVQALLRLPGNSPFLLADSVNADLPWNGGLKTDPSVLDEGRRSLPQRDGYDVRLSQGVKLGIYTAGAAGIGANLGYKATQAAKVEARFALTSQRTLAVLRSAARVSAPLMIGTMLWLTAVSTDGKSVERAIDWWWGQAVDLSELFGDLGTRRVLAEAWQGDARNEADRVLREFMTAGSQRFSHAVGQVKGLQDAVRALNVLHNVAFYATLSGCLVVLAISGLARVNPQAEVVKQLVSRTVAHRVSDLVKQISVQLGIVAALMAPFALGMRYAALDGDPIERGPAGVPATDFPKIP